MGLYLGLTKINKALGGDRETPTSPLGNHHNFHNNYGMFNFKAPANSLMEALTRPQASPASL